ncbi:hypothetical protein [Flavobacterium sp. PL02]|jgi:hypothetical protein|uniref:hypothetical protein n=1 Tax=Flavobacterium sp. PL02 TaxID=3088354 RepID=UPI002B23C157|nr:hypothetical protein [Flavobacterium sp. PL02]MEA9412265.1 hypothetical protein [Flavobacterium sp. PL02]
MKTIFKTVLIVIGILLLATISYLIFVYFFTKESKSIEVYTFPISYNELERRIQKGMIKNSNLNISISDSTYTTRYITLGEDCDSYFFITNLDENKSNEYKEAWIELQAVVDSNFKMIDIFYKNKNEYPDKIKVFEEDFINKLKK